MLSIILSTSVIINSIPKKQDPFVAMALLDEYGKAEQYNPANINFSNGDEMNFNLFIENKMEKIIYVLIKIKILDTSTELPNSTSCTPSQSPTAYELRRIISISETWITPLSFRILNFDTKDEDHEIKKIMFDENIISYNVTINNNLDPRLLFELWIYDSEIDDFSFSWMGLTEEKCAWNQLIFYIK